jgi:hypothetical protein
MCCALQWSRYVRIGLEWHCDCANNLPQRGCDSRLAAVSTAPTETRIGLIEAVITHSAAVTGSPNRLLVGGSAAICIHWSIHELAAPTGQHGSRLYLPMHTGVGRAAYPTVSHFPPSRTFRSCSQEHSCLVTERSWVRDMPS